MWKQMNKPLFSIFAVAMLVPALSFAGGHGVKDYMKKMDANDDGQISAEEHAAAAAKRFQKLDMNGDGVATKDEMKAMREKHKQKYKNKMKGECSGDKKKYRRDGDDES